ncbi:hypothetical protein [Streptomyces zaomyceticus]|uniref:hypothetical protein n=1 Tax=Streptomyces zaomyceticus TaxID=68286 RepID=UPI002E22D942
MRKPNRAVRSKARLDLLDTIRSLLLFGSLLLSLVAAEAWVWLSLIGFVLIAPTYGVKGIHLLRVRHSAAHPDNTP